MGGKYPIWVSLASKYLNSYFQNFLETVKKVLEYGENCAESAVSCSRTLKKTWMIGGIKRIEIK